jgi:hypothetical protein
MIRRVWIHSEVLFCRRAASGSAGAAGGVAAAAAAGAAASWARSEAAVAVAVAIHARRTRVLEEGEGMRRKNRPESG